MRRFVEDRKIRKTQKDLERLKALFYFDSNDETMAFIFDESNF